MSVALADPYKSLAQTYAAAKSPDKADAFFDQEILVLQMAFGEKDSRVADAIEDKAAFLESSDRKEQARDLRSRDNQLRGASLLTPK